MQDFLDLLWWLQLSTVWNTEGTPFVGPQRFSSAVGLVTIVECCPVLLGPPVLGMAFLNFYGSVNIKQVQRRLGRWWEEVSGLPDNLSFLYPSGLDTVFIIYHNGSNTWIKVNHEIERRIKMTSNHIFIKIIITVGAIGIVGEGSQYTRNSAT